MKKILVVILGISGSLLGCQKTPASPADQEVTVPHGQAVPVQLVEGQGQLAVRISDSRCPTGGQCIWAGQAGVNTLLTAGTDSVRVPTLYLGQGPDHQWRRRDSAAVTLANQGYWLYLLAVNPYPTLDGSGAAPKTATLRLTAR